MVTRFAARSAFSQRATFVTVALVLYAALPAVPGVSAAEVQSLSRAHAHNDYEHQRPLEDALAQGFGSVEVDIFLVDGELLVGHDPGDLRGDRTLRSLYLDPLRKRVARNDGSVHGDGKPLTLLIDIKSDATATYRALDRLLENYRDLFGGTQNGLHQPGPVVGIVSGNRDFATIRADPTRHVGIDGRLSDLGSDAPAHLMPLISDHWGRHFTWRGEGPIPAAERAKLKATVEAAHAERRRLRFWATPDTPAVWNVLRKAGVDLINTDDLAGLSRFLRETR